MWLSSHSSWNDMEGEFQNLPKNADEQKKRVQHILSNGLPKENEYFLQDQDNKVVIKFALSIPYQNYISYAIDGMRIYGKQHGIDIISGSTSNLGVFHMLITQNRVLQTWYDNLGKKRSQDAAGIMGSSTGTGIGLTKGDAIKRVSDLKLLLASQQRAFELGVKGFDEGLADINATKAEIKALERRYINTFYFF
jgi:hypothetical protein